MAEGVTEAAKTTGGLFGRVPWASVPAWLVAGVVAALVLVGGIVGPVVLSHMALGQDADAREFLINAVPRMRSCAYMEGDGSYAACDAAEMARTEPDVRWRDGLAPVGWGKGGFGKVYVSDLSETSFRLETTSASGRVFKYDYENGIVTRATVGGGQGSGW